jgi:hypothetical protein
MNRFILLLNISLLAVIDLKGQILPVTLVIQEQTQWCWAAVSKCALDYYGHPVSQCAIAEYTRTTATWHNFGTQKCCDVPSGNCNYWNYDWGESGSISDILKHFGSINIIGASDSLSISDISMELKNVRPFIIRWAWTTGGGHFLLGHGLDNQMIYYMNPWPGEGYKIALYDWVVSSSDHKWKNAMKLRPNATSINDTKVANSVKVYPNPSRGMITIELNSEGGEYLIEVVDVSGQKIYNQKFNNPIKMLDIDLSSLTNGFYFVNIIHDGNCQAEKLLINR